MLTRRAAIVSPAILAASRLSAGPAPTQAGISLAAWSFSGSFFQGRWKLLDLPGILRKDLNITGLEHVNQFFENPTLEYLKKVNRACADNGVRSLLLMVDNEGSTASPDKTERKQAEIAHRKWIDIAHYLGCASIRCNVYGGPENWKEDRDIMSRAAETIRAMLDYAQGSGINILVENHGRASSDPDLLVQLVKKVDHPKFGLLCDLGNWNEGTDRYAAVRKTIPYAKGLSVKGTLAPDLDPAFDMEKLLRTALEGGYSGWWALEVTPRRQRGMTLTANEQFAKEVETVLRAKAMTERVVFGKG